MRCIGVLLEGHHVGLLRSERGAQLDHPIVNVACGIDVGVNGILDRPHRILLHATIIAGQQHAPLGQWHEDAVVNFQLHRQLDLLAIDLEAGRIDVGLQLAQDGGMGIGLEPRRLEVGWQADLQDVDLLLGRAEGLRVGAAQGHELGIEGVPDRCVCVAGPDRIGIDAGDALHVGQRRHIHDRHAGHFGLGDLVEQFADAGRTILRLLHRQGDQVVFGGIEGGGAASG